MIILFQQISICVRSIYSSESEQLEKSFVDINFIFNKNGRDIFSSIYHQFRLYKLDAIKCTIVVCIHTFSKALTISSKILIPLDLLYLSEIYHISDNFNLKIEFNILWHTPYGYVAL